MSASFDTYLSPPKRAWSPKTADLDGGTCDTREDNTSDLQPMITQDVVEDANAGQRTPTPIAHAAGSETSSGTRDLDQPVVRPDQPLLPRTDARRSNIDAAASVRIVHAAAQSLAPGSVLNDRYLVERALGAGGTALVFRARDLLVQDKNSTGARVAIKTPRPDVKDRVKAVARLQHEYRHACALSHPNIVQVSALNCDDRNCFMTMELIEGKSLAALLRDWPTLSEPMKRTILKSCADALGYAHSCDVVHGDFKPANVLVDAQGRVKVFDFGAAAALEESTQEPDSRIPAATPAYASPEVLSGLKPDRRDDVFSFACVAYEVLTGQHPFERLSSLEARDRNKIPPRVWNLSAPEWLALLSALAWEREQRPSNVGTLIDILAPGSAPNDETSPADDTLAVREEPDFAPPEEFVPAHRSWGFFVFVAVALAVLLVATQRQSSDLLDENEIADVVPDVVSGEPSSLLGKPTTLPSAGVASGGIVGPEETLSYPQPYSDPGAEAPAEEVQEEPVAPAAKTAAPSRPASQISFASDSIVTSESAISAVFIVERSEPLTGRVTVHWRVESGTAEEGEDFIGNEGTVSFSDGQAQRAVYIPLRNDLLVEGDETFALELVSAQGGRLGKIARVEATIKDDD